MKNYQMLYENIVLKAWGKTWRSDDPFGLGDTNTLGMLNGELSGRSGHNAKFGLSTAIRKVAREKGEGNPFAQKLMDLDEALWEIDSYEGLIFFLDKIQELFNANGLEVTD